MKKKPAINPTIAQFEKSTALTADQAITLLACGRSRYYLWRSGAEIPEPIDRLIKVILLLNMRTLERLLKEYGIEREDL